MGGEFDATNVIAHNVASLLTRIDLDHTEYLGDTVEEITHTKCGIFKKDCALKTVFTVEQTEESLKVIAADARLRGLSVQTVRPLTSVGNEGLFEKILWQGQPILLSLAGDHQRENAALAAALAEKMGVSPKSICRGLSSAVHPGRLELLRREPLLIYDGAHNSNGVRALCRTLDRAHIADLTVVFACMRDKEIAESLDLLKKYAARFLFTTVQNNPRAETPESLRNRAAALGVNGEAIPTLAEALELAKDENTLVCGSLYLYADLPQIFLK